MSYVEELLRDAFGRWAGREAVVHGGGRLTYRELGGHVAVLAAALAHGTGTVGVLARNRPEALVVHLACHLAGRPVAHVARDASRPVQRTFLRDASATELCHDPNEARAARSLAAEVPGLTPRPLALAPPPPGVDPPAAPPPAPASRVRTLLCTGGTTGVPKGVVHTHALFAPPALEPVALATPGERCLVFTDLSHVSWYFAMPTLRAGGTLVLHEGFDAGAFLRLVPGERVTRVLLSPPQLAKVLDHPECAGADLSSLRLLAYGAAPSAPHRLQQAAERFGPVLQQVYGLTEAGVVSVLTPEDHLHGDAAVRASVGRPAPGVSIEVRDAEGAPLPAGESGEVWMRGPALMAGYLGPEHANEPALHGGWLRTGDLGRLGGDGCLTLEGRCKELLIHHATGTHVYPRLIEEALLGHPAVREAAVWAVPDERHGGDHVHAAVTLTEDAPGAHALRAHVATVLHQDHMVPEHVEVRTDMPLTRAGKIDKSALAGRRERGSEGR
ncbi:class I adenylate-forming enzyme family protein [Streptomyces xiaopingdaonensis]|uniref:class I adenylate-forming enzyme family protein n=1 Tax=Streptomyces xiaopingdaonensis TaxID=1565415 RepID=UPI0003010F76|nr:AMP-binding protein [Streptomyces xiaopingdaonensis]